MEDKNTDNKEKTNHTFLCLIKWCAAVLVLFAKKVNSKLRNEEQTPAAPSWIKNAVNQNGKVKVDTLQAGIAEFLYEAGGTKDSIGSGLILNITMAQFSKVISAVRQIESDPFMQDVMRAVIHEISASDGGGCADLCLANLALLDKKYEDAILTVEPIGHHLPLAGNIVHIFRGRFESLSS